MKINLLIIFTIAMLTANFAQAKKGFEGVRCDLDLVGQMKGRQIANDTVSKTEAQYKNIFLKDMGAEQLVGKFSVVTWRICHQIIVLLQNGDTVEDAVQLSPMNDSEIPVLLSCHYQGNVIDNVLMEKNQAWQVDLEKKKFMSLSTKNLNCSGKDF